MLLAAILAGCGSPPANTADAPQFLTTIPPVAALLEPITSGAADIQVIVPPGASPHTYDLRPADARRAVTARAVLLVDPAVDGWAANLSTHQRVELFALVPKEYIRTYADVAPSAPAQPNPHFWLDPLTVRALVPILADTLAHIDPERAQMYQANAKVFAERLAELHKEIEEILEPAKDKAVIQFHPSMDYLLFRYGFRVEGVVEPSPGREPTPKELERLVHRARAEDVRVIITEPQLPDAPVRALAEAMGARVVELDPLGGRPGLETYHELLLYNAHALAKAFS